MYKISVTRHYYGPRAAKSYITDEIGRERRFETRAEAEAVVQQLNGSVYYTAHNESGRPTYRVVRYRKT